MAIRFVVAMTGYIVILFPYSFNRPQQLEMEIGRIQDRNIPD